MFRSDNIGSWTALRARTDGASTALVAGDERVTYRELDTRCARVAGALAAAGVQAGDRVAVALKNRIEFLEMLFGAARLGAIFVPLNFRLSAQEVGYALADSGASLVVAQQDTLDAVREALTESGAELSVLLVDGDEADYAAWRDAGEPRDAALVAGADPVTIVYTSGTTGPPKGAVITHENVMVNVQNYLADYDLRRDDATLVVNPIFHVVLYILCVPLLYKGGKVVLMENFVAEEAVRIAERERITTWFAIPTAWQMILDTPGFENFDRSRLRFIGSGGMACPGPLMDRFAALGLAYRQGYGLTETTSSAAVMSSEDQEGRRGSIGRTFFHVEARIADEEDRPLPPGAEGEIQLRGRNICAGYWNKPRETAEAFAADGWLRTGDIGRADDEGYLWIVDRKKDLIISGGENIASIEVEQAVLTHPAVLETAVIAAPHPRWGETPRAVVVLRSGATLTEAELIAHCRERIAHYKCPTSMVVVDELPKTANGKIAKAALRALREPAASTS
jgi:fatty-acyl-CoA synthase